MTTVDVALPRFSPPPPLPLGSVRARLEELKEQLEGGDGDFETWADFVLESERVVRGRLGEGGQRGAKLSVLCVLIDCRATYILVCLA